MDLVIIEAKGKIKKIQGYLGSKYKVVCSLGHILDLPEKKLGVNIKKDFEPTYEIMSGKKQTLSDIIDYAKKADTVYLMTDPDREGAAIARNIYNRFDENTKKKVKRAITNSITKNEIIKAIDNAFDLQEENDLYESYEARRILDRLCGYKCSFVVKQATGGSSAGRVQSAALRILAERENEISAFIPEEYWPIEIDVLNKNKEKVTASIKKPNKLDIKNEDEALKIKNALQKDKTKVLSYTEKEVKVSPNAPFTTSSLIQSAASLLKWSDSKTMSVAQSLYQNSSITYHRTDSTYIIPDFIDSIRDHITTNYNNSYLPNQANLYLKKTKNAQEAHEAVRATDINVTSYGTGDEAKLYQLIWKRTVASQMTNGVNVATNVEFICSDYVFSASGSRVKFDGFRKVWNYSDKTDTTIPEFKDNEVVNIEDIRYEQKFTTPPPRYSVASFNKKLETEGIGRPATFASISKTLTDRKYITVKASQYQVLDLGLKVVDFIVKTDFCFADTKFTSDMEDKLDDIKSGGSKIKVLTDFWERLKTDIDNAKEAKNKLSITNEKCPKCKENDIDAFLLKKVSKYGTFLSCSNYSNKEIKCDYKINLDKDGKPFKKKEIVYSDYECPKCKEKMIERTGKYGIFYGCSSYFKTKCNGMRDKDGSPVESKKKKNKWKK